MRICAALLLSFCGPLGVPKERFIFQSSTATRQISEGMTFPFPYLSNNSQKLSTLYPGIILAVASCTAALNCPSRSVAEENSRLAGSKAQAAKLPELSKAFQTVILVHPKPRPTNLDRTELQSTPVGRVDRKVAPVDSWPCWCMDIEPTGVQPLWDLFSIQTPDNHRNDGKKKIEAGPVVIACLWQLVMRLRCGG